MTQRWQEFFEKEGGKYSSPLEYAITHWNYHLPMYHYIRHFASKNGRILDVGCGPGYSDIYLQSCGYDVVGIDNDEAIVQRAKAQADAFGSSATFVVGDAFNLASYYDQFDLAYSVGVVEHFDRNVTVQLVSQQAKCAKRVLTMIPTRFIKYTAGLSDERLYSIGQLAAIVEDAGLRVIGRFGYGDIPAGIHPWIKRLLPYGAYRLLQNRFAYATGIAVVGERA